MAVSYAASVIERRKSAGDFATYYAAPGQSSVSVSSENPFSYGSGVYVPAKKKYYFTGGGHDDWLGSEIGAFYLLTLAWARTDESAKIHYSVEDSSVPFQSSDSLGRKAWRNPSGRFAPISCHMYGGMAYLPSIDKIHVAGAAPYNSGMGGPGGTTFIDAATGQWDESGAYAGSETTVNNMSSVIPSVQVVNASLTPTGQVLTDCVFYAAYGMAPSSAMIDPINKTKYAHSNYYGAGQVGTSAGCVVPDPLNAGRKAYIAESTSTTCAVFPRVDQVRSDGVALGNIESLTYANASPLGAGGNSRLIYMGDYIPGNTKIAAFKSGLGLYVLDTATWLWSGPVAGSPTAAYGDGVWKRFEYFPDLQMFGLFGAQGDAFYALPIPDALK